MNIVTQPPPSNTFNPTQASLDALLGPMPEEVDKRGWQVAQTDVLAEFLDNAPMSIPIVPVNARTVDVLANSTTAAAKGVANATAMAPAPYISKLEAALDHAAAGFVVFPCVPNAKTPAISNWQNLATTDPKQIAAWWSQWPNANVGIITTPFVVVDIDPRHGGDVSAQLLALTEDMPHTLCSRTAGGGSHMIYRLPEHVIVRGGKDKLGRGIDIRSWGGLIVAPGSTVNGNDYAWLNKRPIAMAPQWLIDRCRAPRAKSADAGKRIVDETPAGIECALQWVAHHSPTAVLGELKDTAYKVACRLFDFGVSEATATELLRAWGDARCEPRLEDDTVAHTIRSAQKYRGNTIGSDSPDAPTGFEPVEIAPRDARHKTGHVDPSAKPRELHYISFTNAAARALTHGAEPLIDGILDCGAMSIVYGESNTGKSFLEMDQDFHIAAGMQWAGREVKQGGVVWVAAEGGSGIYKRVAALKKHYERDDVPFFIVPCPVNLLNPKADVQPLITLIKQAEQDSGQAVVKVTLDTLSRVISGGDENSPVDMGMLVHNFDAIREGTGAHLGAVHHSGKNTARGARGHSLLRAATDTEIEVADRYMTVTKQRDLDGDVTLRFELHATPIGVDLRGKAVNSCWVEVREKTTIPDEPIALDGENSEFAGYLAAAIMSEYGKTPEDIAGQSFTTALANSCGNQIAITGARKRKAGSKAMLAHISRMMLIMLESGWIKKGVWGQWVWIKTHIPQNAQT
jgi:hypothetical protein